MNKYIYITFFILSRLISVGQSEVYNLPLVIIDTEGIEIVDEPKVMASMKVVNNSDGKNRLTDTANEYDGFIGIEFRGSSSQSFPKKPFGFETWDAQGNDMDASFFGWPEEEDWILYPSYNEKSMMHNVVAMRIAREMGMYASRTQYVEVFVNKEYQGVYVFMEKIKRDKGRVDINKLKEDEEEGDDLTGGYIIKIDKTTGSNNGSWQSAYLNPPSSFNRGNYLYESPNDITQIQKEYIRNYIKEFEDVMMSESAEDTELGFRKYIDVESFVKFFLVNEIANNVDGYRISSFLHKDKNGKLKAGPVWDFDIAYGNANYCEGSRYDIWSFRFNERCPDDNWLVPFWWYQLLNSDDFKEEVVRTYKLYRESGFLQIEQVQDIIAEYEAELAVAQERNFLKWPILGSYVWPQPEPVASSWKGEVQELKSWLTNRLQWLDNNIENIETGVRSSFAPLSVMEESTMSIKAYPNPFTDYFQLELNALKSETLSIEVYNTSGYPIYHQKIKLEEGHNSIPILKGKAVTPGIYILKLQGKKGEETYNLKILSH